MHGKKRNEYKSRLLDPVLSQQIAQKSRQWHKLTATLAERDKDESTTSEGAVGTLSLLEKALAVNPDPLHLWNQRRRLLLLPSDESLFSLATELSLTQAALQRNPKAYGAWFHRKWTIRKYTQETTKTEPIMNVLESELLLTETFLAMDERNFHCWNYRRFVVGLCGSVQVGDDSLDGSWWWVSSNDKVVMGSQVAIAPDAEPGETASSTTERSSVLVDLLRTEWDFTTNKIQDNFSNFSAFHYRSKLFDLAIQWLDMKALNLVENELQLVENAVYTEPSDQTAWWYHRFLIDWLVASSEIPRENIVSILAQQVDTMTELIDEVQDEAKWGLLALLRVSEALQVFEETDARREEMMVMLGRLEQLDPDRRARYAYMKDQRAAT